MNILGIDFAEIIFRIKIFSFSFSILFGFLTVYFIVQIQKLAQVKLALLKDLISNAGSEDGGALDSRWEEIMRHFESEREAEWKFAIIEADKLVDDILKSAGYIGDTMGERLMGIEKGQILSLEGLWEAHKIRNKLVHDQSYFLRYAEARRAIDAYRRTLEELGAV